MLSEVAKKGGGRDDGQPGEAEDRSFHWSGAVVRGIKTLLESDGSEETRERNLHQLEGSEHKAEQAASVSAEIVPAFATPTWGYLREKSLASRRAGACALHASGAHALELPCGPGGAHGARKERRGLQPGVSFRLPRLPRHLVNETACPVTALRSPASVKDA
jgi:hypothetical protein